MKILDLQEHPSVINCTDTVTQGVLSDFNRQSASLSNYKSQHTIEAPTVIARNCSCVCVTSLSQVCARFKDCEHLHFLDNLVYSDLILDDKGFNIHAKCRLVFNLTYLDIWKAGLILLVKKLNCVTKLLKAEFMLKK